MKGPLANKKLTKEMKWGMAILSLYLVWASLWLVYKYFPGLY